MAGHSPLPWVNADSIRRIKDAREWTVAFHVDEPDAELIVRAVNSHAELLAALKEMTAAVAAAMRVVADLDAMHIVGFDADTRQQRFADELKIAGVVNGFGVRAQAAIAKAEATHD